MPVSIDKNEKKNIMATIHLTSKQFISKVADYKANHGNFKFLGKRPALLDFYAEWCAPCRTLSPVLEDLSNEFEGRVDMYKINVDEEEELAALFGIHSIPTLIYVSLDGRMQRSQGAMGKVQLREMIERVLLSK